MVKAGARRLDANAPEEPAAVPETQVRGPEDRHRRKHVADTEREVLRVDDRELRRWVADRERGRGLELVPAEIEPVRIEDACEVDGGIGSEGRRRDGSPRDYASDRSRDRRVRQLRVSGRRTARTE